MKKINKSRRSYLKLFGVTILSSLLLKEKVGLRRWIAVSLGFIGALVVMRPGFNQINIASLAALGTVITYAFYVISTRKLSTLDSPLLTLIFTGLIFHQKFYLIFLLDLL